LLSSILVNPDSREIQPLLSQWQLQIDILQGSVKHMLHHSNANSTAAIYFKSRITSLEFSFFLNPSQNAFYAQAQVQPACAVGWLTVANRQLDNYARCEILAFTQEG